MAQIAGISFCSGCEASFVYTTRLLDDGLINLLIKHSVKRVDVNCIRCGSYVYLDHVSM